MWIFLNNAFISAVQHNDDPNLLVVRARVEGDLERVFEPLYGKEALDVNGIKVERHEDRDYLFRVVVTKNQFASAMHWHASQIDYGNFKDSIEDHDYHNACSRVWSVMNGLQEIKHGVGKYIYRKTGLGRQARR